MSDGESKEYSPAFRLFYYKLDLQFFGKKSELLKAEISELEKQIVESKQEKINLINQSNSL
jgi:hypothetical protein